MSHELSRVGAEPGGGIEGAKGRFTEVETLGSSVGRRSFLTWTRNYVVGGGGDDAKREWLGVTVARIRAGCVRGAPGSMFPS
jgi:hypothetical protein